MDHTEDDLLWNDDLEMPVAEMLPDDLGLEAAIRDNGLCDDQDLISDNQMCDHVSMALCRDPSTHHLDG